MAATPARAPERGLASAVESAIAIALLAGAVALGLAMRADRLPMSELRGDEGTYVAMALSLVRDGDLGFTAADGTWARAQAPSPLAVILQIDDDGRLAYSKPVLYPLAAAPFAAAFGAAWGLVALNALALVAGSAVAYGWLCRLGGPEARGRARWTLATALAASVAIPLLAWRMTESMQLALALAGIALVLGAGEAAAPPRSFASALRRIALGGLLLGLLVSLREPNAIVAAGVVVARFAEPGARRWRAGAVAAAGVVAGYLAALAITVALTGAINPYKAFRASFDGVTGYPDELEAPAVLAAFHARTATSSLGATPTGFEPATSAYAALYFWIGRHTGLLVYFPAAIALLATVLPRPGPRGRILLATFAALALFYLLWLPRNYQGGETFLGNRYILAAFPCLLFALERLPSARALVASAAVATAIGLSALVSTAQTVAIDPTSQSHAHAGLFRLLPYESTASHVDGRRDRYWGDELVRFVDPYAQVGARSFVLPGGATPAAELEIASRGGARAVRFRVQTDAVGARLVLADWRGSRRVPLPPASATGATGEGVVVELPLSPSWRRHPFWWAPGVPYDVDLVRLELRDGAGRRALGELAYLGLAREPTVALARVVESEETFR